MRARGFLLALLLLQAACGGGGGGSPPIVQPPPPVATVTIYYLRADPFYDGWGLHLWGDAIGGSVATGWASPRLPDRIENDIAVFEIPLVDSGAALNFIAHNGDLKSPVHDMSIVPRTFGFDAWLVQDSVASQNGNIGTPYASLAAAQAALAALGDASASLDLSPVAPAASDSGLPADWSDSAAFIEIYVRGYQDSNGDGIGDLQGLISRLDYLQGLGIKGIWLMPVFESADNDHGYAVEDYRAIETDYGSMADFEMLLDEAHARGIAIIVDYVMNHAASTNPLFLDATTGPANARFDWFVWEDVRPQGWNTFAGDPWRNNGNGWYYGVFSALMPDFNLENPEVVAYHEDNLRFWLNKGVDGFRFDAVGVLFENGQAGWNNQPENHVLLNNVLGIVSGYGKRFMVCEAPDDPAAYADPSSCGRAFAFQVPGTIFNTVRNFAVDGGLLTGLGGVAGDAQPWILSNHDSFAGDRPWNQLDGDVDHYTLAAATYLLSSRNPFTYYGEEVGMANASGLTGDHALRTPMSWTADTVTAGFTTGTPFRSLSANVATHNVADEEGDAGSLLEYYRSLYRLRTENPVIGAGVLTVQSNAGDAVLLFTRAEGSAVAVVAINYSAAAQQLDADTGRSGTTFAASFGASGQRVADVTGTLQIDVPARSAVVYISQP
ncbi:MAG: alpha-amylase family glycosyl hydrolase [Gammaproteobacteria bacterium]|nr:alpha-amylase family glycosyl hydrolase [Gammaproteobacteria bacterium]MDH5618517.1 alpha-amylase family glycosyl hydrolase [Gammaproteobacteria bacterium]